MSNIGKVLLGGVTLLSIPYILAMIVLVDAAEFSQLLPLHVAFFLVTFGLWAFYIGHASRNEALSPESRRLWIALIIFGSFLVEPVYFWLHIARKPTVSPTTA
jgi:hypothetical protein